MKPKRWSFLWAGTVMLLFLGLLYGWSVFKAPLSQMFAAWTEADLALTFSISMTFFCLGGFFGGKLQQWLKPAPIVLLAAAILFVGFFGASRLNPASPRTSLLLLYFCYGALCGGGVGIGYNLVISTVTRWFPDQPGLASGILMMGFGFGGILLGGVVNSLIGRIGLPRSFLVLAFATAGVMAAGSAWMRLPPAPSGEAAQEEQEGRTPLEMLQSPAFWTLCLYCILMSSAGLLVISHAASIAVAFGAPPILGLIVSVANGGGRVLLGGIFDRYGRKWAMILNALCLLAAGGLLLSGALAGSGVPVLAGLVLAGISYGGCPPLTSAAIRGLFGPKHHSVNFSLANFQLIPASILGPMLSSSLLARSGGTYHTTFLMIMALAAAALAVTFWMNRIGWRPEQPEQQEGGARWQH